MDLRIADTFTDSLARIEQSKDKHFWSVRAGTTLQDRIETVGDDADLQEVYDTERHLLYVACTRARDQLLVTGVAPASEFLDDLLIT